MKSGQPPAKGKNTQLRRPQVKPAPAADISIRHAIIALITAIIFISALTVYVYSNRHSDVMLAISSKDDTVSGLQSSVSPNISSEALLNWSKLAVSETFTYNFNDVGPRILAARRFFTEDGWNSFLSAIRTQGLLAQVQTQRQFVTTIPMANAVIISEGEVSGVYYWTVQMSIVISVYTGVTSVKNGVVTLKIAKTPTSNSDSGYPFGIVQVVR
jgi:intracellular multiplication protein IcmL